MRPYDRLDLIQVILGGLLLVVAVVVIVAVLAGADQSYPAGGMPSTTTCRTGWCP